MDENKPLRRLPQKLRRSREPTESRGSRCPYELENRLPKKFTMFQPRPGRYAFTFDPREIADECEASLGSTLEPIKLDNDAREDDCNPPVKRDAPRSGFDALKM